MTSTESVRELPARYLQLAEDSPDRDAIVYARGALSGRRLSWSDIANRSEELLLSYRERGVRPGSRCALTLVDHVDIVPALVALWRADATAVLVDSAWGDRLRNNIVGHSQANFALDLFDDAEMLRIRPSDDFDHELPDGTAMLGYTSGSTGDPKGIPFTHSKLALTMHYSAAAATARHGAQPRRIGCSARLSGSGVLNLNYTWAPFSDAATVVLPELTVANARDYWNLVVEHGVDQTYLFPALVEMVNKLAAPRPEGVAPLCLTGSAPVTDRLQSRFKERFGINLVNCFGISEAMCTIFFGAVGADGNPTTSIGVPWLLQVRLVDDAGQEILGPGEGEMQLSGPTLLDFYYGNPSATAAAFDGRWFQTGDMVRRDAAGNYHIVGRRKHVVMKGGFSIYLNEVEDAALAIPGVLEAAAVPLVEDGLEDIGLLVRLDEGGAATTTEVLAAVRKGMGPQRAPRRVVEVTDALPRTGPEKLDRRAVGQIWSDRVGQSGLALTSGTRS